MMTIEELHERFGFDKDITPQEWYERREKLGHGLNPVYHKYLPAAWIIQNIWSHYCAGNISSGKARELTTAVIEEHINGTLEK